jgi:hypothetical protein
VGFRARNAALKASCLIEALIPIDLGTKERRNVCIRRYVRRLVMSIGVGQYVAVRHCSVKSQTRNELGTEVFVQKNAILNRRGSYPALEDF